MVEALCQMGDRTKHVRIRYSIDYDGTDIRKLSPGTRGIVLLLLYLALDDADDRPLIIDQPRRISTPNRFSTTGRAFPRGEEETAGNHGDPQR